MMSRQLEAARRYMDWGWTVVPVEYRQKKPDWVNVTKDNAHKYFPPNKEMNIAVLLGPASGGLADVDLDCPEAIALAPYYLPGTARFGRETAKASHWLFKVSECAPVFCAKDEKGDVLVELRCATEGSKVSTVFPPSTHKDTGEAIEWADKAIPIECPIGHDELLACVKRLAVACLILRHAGQGAVDRWRQYNETPRLPESVKKQLRALMGIKPPPTLPPRRTILASDSLFDAYNRAHQRDWGEPGKGTCPICKHQDCFGRLPEIPSRWSCFSLGHPDGWGVRGDRCTTGDAVDVDAFERFSGMDPKRARMTLIEEQRKGAA